MKRYKSFLLYGLLLCGVLSCEKPVIPGAEVEDGNLVISLMSIEQIPFSGATTRSEESEYFNRLNFAVYDSLGPQVRKSNQQSGDKNFGTATFQLEPGKYKVVVLAHSSNGNPSMTDYKKIQFKNDYGFTDTFLCYDSVEIGDTPVNLPANPKRIVSLCRFVISDTIPSDVSRMRFLYTGGSGSLDATTGLGCVKSRQNEFFDVEPGTAPTTFDLYTFLHGDEGTIHLQATAYDEEDNVLTDREFDIPLKRRKMTKVSGQYFNTSSAGLTITISLDPEWEGEEEISY